MNLEFIKSNLEALKLQLSNHKVTLVAVSKTHPKEYIEEAYKNNQFDFGENKAQEMQSKYLSLPKDIKWHFIGHLQSNKIKYIIDFVYLIHSVDSQKLLSSINKEAIKVNRIVNILLQVYIAKEETKFGLDKEELDQILSNIGQYSNIKICGLMGMATNTDDQIQIKSEFAHLKSVINEVKAKYFSQEPRFNILSIGMSGDYQLAIEEGSTMIRVGSKIFGIR
jgi:pyridoxal phosphate enzyme (YggS family)